MPFADRKLHYRTIKCDGPGCDKQIEFELSDVKTIEATEWLLGVRAVVAGDERKFCYCSDVCEVKGVTTGQHNIKEKPTVVPASEGDVRAAAAQAGADAATTEALKTGQVTLT